MIIKIDPKKLNFYLSHKGPYIYYYNANDVDGNDQILGNIIYFSKKYPQLKIFEIDWADQIKYNIYTNLMIINNIYLYFDGILMMKQQKPNQREIENLFEEAVKCFNSKIEKRAQDVGKKSKNIILGNEINHIIRYDRVYNTRMKRFLKSKIISQSKQILSKEYKKHLDSHSLKKGDLVDKNILAKILGSSSNPFLNNNLNKSDKSNGSLLKKVTKPILTKKINYNHVDINIKEILDKNKCINYMKLPPKKRYTSSLLINDNRKNERLKYEYNQINKSQ